MDLGKAAQELIEGHSRRTQHLAPLIRATARRNYEGGVRDCLRRMQELAVADGLARPELLTAPVGIQPAHSALPQEGE